MKLRAYYKKIVPKKKFKIIYDKTSKGRPAWVRVEGLPKSASFISIHLGKKGREGRRIQGYKIYLTREFYLPINYTKEEMRKFYDQFSKVYDKELKCQKRKANIVATKFFIKKIKKYIKKGELLDLGAGTGLITEMLVKEGYIPATLIDYSPGMLNKAKKRKGLKGCKFVRKDIRKLDLGKKFDLVFSFFSFGSDSYFDKEELNKILKIVHRHLKRNGVFAVYGHGQISEFKRFFKQLEKGTHTLNFEKKFYTDYFIGRKK